jgi:hypothetical protein
MNLCRSCCANANDAAAAAATAPAAAEAGDHEGRVAGAAQHPAQGGSRRPQNANDSALGQPAAAHPAGQHRVDADVGGRCHQQVRHQGQAQSGAPGAQAAHARAPQAASPAAADHCPAAAAAGHHHLCPAAANHRQQVREKFTLTTQIILIFKLKKSIGRIFI